MELYLSVYGFLILFTIKKIKCFSPKFPRTPNLCLFFSLASVAAELLAILGIFTQKQLQNISETNTATLWQKLAADSS